MSRACYASDGEGEQVTDAYKCGSIQNRTCAPFSFIYSFSSTQDEVLIVIAFFRLPIPQFTKLFRLRGHNKTPA